MKDIFHEINYLLYSNNESLLQKEKIKRIDFFIQKYFGENKKEISVLDLGCGSGVISMPLIGFGYKLTCVDLDKDLLRLLKDQLKKKSKILIKPKIIKSSIEQYRSREKFDVVILTEVLEHVNNPTEIIKKINFLLKNNGILILSIPNGFGTYEIFFDWPIIILRRILGVKSSPGRYHINFFSQKRIKKLLQKNNFCIVDWAKSCFFPILPRHSFLERIDVSLSNLAPTSLVNGWMMIVKKVKTDI